MRRSQSEDGLEVMSLEHLEGLILFGHLLRGQGLLVRGHRHRGRGQGGGGGRGRDHYWGGEASGVGGLGLMLLLLNLNC